MSCVLITVHINVQLIQVLANQVGLYHPFSGPKSFSVLALELKFEEKERFKAFWAV
jgi:hypothetical protein